MPVSSTFPLRTALFPGALWPHIISQTLLVCLFLLTIITPGDLVLQLLHKEWYYDAIVIAAIYLIALLVHGFICAQRTRAYVIHVRSIPRSGLPWPSWPSMVRRAIRCGWARTSVISWETRPRSLLVRDEEHDPAATLLGSDHGGASAVHRHRSRLAMSSDKESVLLDDLGKLKVVKESRLSAWLPWTKTPPAGFVESVPLHRIRAHGEITADTTIVSLEKAADVWGTISHPGWGESAHGLVEYHEVIIELPNLLEGKAVSLAPVAAAAEFSDQASTNTELRHGSVPPGHSLTTRYHHPDPRTVALLQRPRGFGVRDYVAYLASIGVSFPSPEAEPPDDSLMTTTAAEPSTDTITLVKTRSSTTSTYSPQKQQQPQPQPQPRGDPVDDFLRRYEYARFSGRPLSAAQFQALTHAFGWLIAHMALDAVVLERAVQEMERHGQGFASSSSASSSSPSSSSSSLLSSSSSLLPYSSASSNNNNNNSGYITSRSMPMPSSLRRRRHLHRPHYSRTPSHTSSLAATAAGPFLLSRSRTADNPVSGPSSPVHSSPTGSVRRHRAPSRQSQLPSDQHSSNNSSGRLQVPHIAVIVPSPSSPPSPATSVIHHRHHRMSTTSFFTASSSSSLSHS